MGLATSIIVTALDNNVQTLLIEFLPFDYFIKYVSSYIGTERSNPNPNPISGELFNNACEIHQMCHLLMYWIDVLMVMPNVSVPP